MKGKSGKNNEVLWKNCIRACAAAFLMVTAVISLPQYVSAADTFVEGGAVTSAASHPGFIAYNFAGAKSFSTSLGLNKQYSMTQIIKEATGAEVKLDIAGTYDPTGYLLNLESREKLYNAKPGDTVEVSMMAYRWAASGIYKGVNKAITVKVIIAPKAFVSNVADNAVQIAPSNVGETTTAIMYRSDALELTISEAASTEARFAFQPQVIKASEAKKLSDADIEKLYGVGVTCMKDLNQYVDTPKQVNIPLTNEIKTAIKKGAAGDYRVPVSCVSTVDGKELKYVVGVVVMDDKDTEFNAVSYSSSALSAKTIEGKGDAGADTDDDDNTNVNNTSTVSVEELEAVNSAVSDVVFPAGLTGDAGTQAAPTWKMLRLLTDHFQFSSYMRRYRWAVNDDQMHSIGTFIDNGIGTDEDKKEATKKFLTPYDGGTVVEEGMELQTLQDKGYFPLKINSVLKKNDQGVYAELNSNPITATNKFFQNMEEGSYIVRVDVFEGNSAWLNPSGGSDSTADQTRYYEYDNRYDLEPYYFDDLLGADFDPYYFSTYNKHLYYGMNETDPMFIPYYKTSNYQNTVSLYVNVAEKPELSFDKTKYVIQYADYKGDYAGDSTLPLDITLKLNGQVVTDAATLSKISFTNKKIDKFTGKTWNIADISTDGTLTLSGKQSGIMELSMSYNGTESTNKAVVIIPGDLDASGSIGLNDAVQEAAIVRGTVTPEDISAAYGEDLTNMNNLPGVDVDDIVKIVAMIRGISDYYNGPVSAGG